MQVAGREVIKLRVESANSVPESNCISAVVLIWTHGGHKAVDFVH